MHFYVNFLFSDVVGSLTLDFPYDFVTESRSAFDISFSIAVISGVAKGLDQAFAHAFAGHFHQAQFGNFKDAGS